MRSIRKNGIEYKIMTKKEWRNTHKDFKGIHDGQHYIMCLENGVTCSVPVKVI